MEPLTEWTFEGIPEQFSKYGMTATAPVIYAAYMIVYDKVDFLSI